MPFILSIHCCILYCGLLGAGLRSPSLHSLPRFRSALFPPPHCSHLTIVMDRLSLRFSSFYESQNRARRRATPLLPRPRVRFALGMQGIQRVVMRPPAKGNPRVEWIPVGRLLTSLELRSRLRSASPIVPRLTGTDLAFPVAVGIIFHLSSLTSPMPYVCAFMYSFPYRRAVQCDIPNR